MSNFRLLGKAMIDFYRVRAVICSPGIAEDHSDAGLAVIYGDGQQDFVYDATPTETLKTCYAEWQAQDAARDAVTLPDLYESAPPN